MFKTRLMLHMAFELLWILPAGLCGQTADIHEKLSAPAVHNYAVTSDSFVQGLLQVACEFHIPLGIEWVNTKAAHTKLDIKLADATVKELIEAIVKTQPDYRIDIGNGIVDVVPTTVTPEQNFLSLTVGSFEVRHALVEAAQQELRNLIKARIAPTTKAGGVAGSLTSNVGEPEIDLRLENATVKDILDAIAATSSKNVWVVTLANSPSLTATGFRRTASLRNVTIVDDDQPIWEIFSWCENVFRAIPPE